MNPEANSSEWVVRAMAPADAEAVSALTAQLGYQRSPQQIAEWLAGCGSRGAQAAFVACLGAEVAGWIEVSIVHHLQSAPHALIGGLVVKDGIRGQGIGRALCARAEEWAWAQSVDVVRVTSRSTRQAAHRFYVRDGYRVEKTSLVFDKNRPR